LRVQRGASLPARPARFEIEAISASLRDLTDFAHGFVKKSGNIAHIPSPFLLALNKIASNLDRGMNGS
jgi:hypothetical protein